MNTAPLLQWFMADIYANQVPFLNQFFLPMSVESTRDIQFLKFRVGGSWFRHWRGRPFVLVIRLPPWLPRGSLWSERWLIYPRTWRRPRPQWFFSDLRDHQPLCCVGHAPSAPPAISTHPVMVNVTTTNITIEWKPLDFTGLFVSKFFSSVSFLLYGNLDNYPYPYWYYLCLLNGHPSIYLHTACKVLRAAVPL